MLFMVLPDQSKYGTHELIAEAIRLHSVQSASRIENLSGLVGEYSVKRDPSKIGENQGIRPHDAVAVSDEFPREGIEGVISQYANEVPVLILTENPEVRRHSFRFHKNVEFVQVA